MADVVPHPHDWLKKYVDRGFSLLFYPPKVKGPQGKDAVGWITRVYKPEDYKEGDNVGVRTGTEISPGRYLVDIDFDNPISLKIAEHILPPTGFGFGRASRFISHAFYTVPEPFPSMVFTDIDGKVLVECRCLKADGSVGLQTMLPPSEHPSGERVTLRDNGELTHSTVMPFDMRLIAVGTILYSHLGNGGLLHNARMALSGFLFQCGLEQEDVLRVGIAIAKVSKNNETDFVGVTNTTVQKIRNNQHIQGAGDLAKIIGENGKKVCAKIREWLGTGSEFIHDANDRILANNQENIYRALKKLDVILHYDEFNSKEMIQYGEYAGPLEDSIANRLWLDIDTQFHFRPQREFFTVYISDLAHRHPVHPVREYFNSLRWDGVPRIATWLIELAGAGDSEYTRAVSSLVLIAAVRRIRKPGCQYHEMLVLESSQGLQKSSAIKMLCPRDEWFSDDLPLNVDSKQIIERTAGKMIVEASDLSGMGRAGIEQLKAMLSRPVDGPVRLAYARLPIERPRQFILIGTTNSHTYLKDGTGNRRFWPMRVVNFDLELLKANRDQMWAEAAQLEAQGVAHRLPQELWADAEVQQLRRLSSDSWEAILEEKLPRDRVQRHMPHELFAMLGIPVVSQDERHTERLEAMMQRMGFKKLPMRRGKVVARGWVREAVEGQTSFTSEAPDTPEESAEDEAIKF